MSASSPARWFLAALERPQLHCLSQRRLFHTTASRNKLEFGEKGQYNRKPTPYEKLLYRAADNEKYDSKLRTPRTRKGALLFSQGVESGIKHRAKTARRYTAKELEALSELYTPQQMEALKAAEEAIDTKDLVVQAAMRTDPAALPYLDDLASIDPVLDKLRQGPEIKYGMAVPGERKGRSVQTDKPEGRGGKGKMTAAQQRLADADEDPHLRRLIAQTGLTKTQIERLRVKTLVIHRVMNQTLIGKVSSLYALVIAGNGDGLLGLGEGKATELADAQRQAMMRAIRNMKPIPRYEGRTTYGDLKAKVAGVIVELNARPPGMYLPPGCLTNAATDVCNRVRSSNAASHL